MFRSIWFLVETVGSLLATACVLRAAATRFRLSPRNPLSQFVLALTDWLVRPIGRLVPARRGNDWPSLLAALLLSLVLASIWMLMVSRTSAAPPLGAIVMLACYWLIKWSLYLLIGLVIFQALLSWINPDAPMAPALNVLTHAFLTPIRRVLPLIGGVDLSPLVLVVAAQLLLSLLESALLALLPLP